MSMLAERKRKQKWTLNPRGKQWSEDANKFGQKMLEKMGWQHGKGLGVKEDGMTEHIRIAYKNDNKGMGYKERDDQWTEHESKFTALLESLAGGQKPSKETKLKSLEQKSQSSRARVHYYKFTRGKDLSRYSEKDLANIFGRKTLDKPVKKEPSSETEEPIAKESKNHNDMLVNAGSMTDYFKKKLPNFSKSNGLVVGTNGVLKRENSESEAEEPSHGFGYTNSVNTKREEIESENEARPTFGLGFSSTKPKTEKDDSESESDIRPAFGLGFNTSKNSKPSFLSYVAESSENKRKAEKTEESMFSPRKKSKKLKNASKDNVGIANPAFNPMSTPVKVEKHYLDPIDEIAEIENNSEVTGTVSSKKSKRQKTNSLIEEITEEQIMDNSKNKKQSKKDLDNSFNSSSNDSLNIHSDTPKKKKSKADLKNSSNISTNNNVGTSIDKTPIKKKKSKKDLENSLNNITAETPKKEKKRKNKEIYNNPLFNESLEESNIVVETKNSHEIKLKKKNKKKNNASSDENKQIYVNPNFDENNDCTLEESHYEPNPYEVSNTKVKKNKEEKPVEAFSNIAFNDEECENEETNVTKTNEYEVTRNKSKKKTKKVKLEIDNPNFAETDGSIVLPTGIEENPYEVKLKKKKKKSKIIQEDQTPKENSVNPYEVQTKKKKGIVNSGLANPALDLNNSQNDDSLMINDCDLILNITCTPVTPKTDISLQSTGTINSISNTRRKSVRFSDITQEHIIPNNEDLKEMAKKGKNKKGIDNFNFNKGQNHVEENVTAMAKTLDNYQAELENDINEGKVKTVTVDDIMVGEVGNSNGGNENLPEGTKLKFKYANFNSETPFYHMNQVGPRKSYKHLIKGDILLQFKNTNLHEIQGYANKVNE